ncbi:glycoprotease family-domain-containing protein [Lasiosphaeris hirsuta]|uniref:Glycoprotease family-domain-containing protein n=1 Tax=Lasiosphaeris hirsuta TaxID=260670 RepID=A0AA40BA83_9PEZI|nr:glycoprotease family-domain-containing protein [Lasiosphaeris hirsuta]
MNESRTRPLHSGPLNPPLESTREDWEDWEDDEPMTPINSGDGPLLSPDREPAPTAQRPSISAARQSMQNVRRLKSRKRQKAQNAEAGISLVTDMTKFRQQQHIAQLMKSGPGDRQSRTGKFVDAAALKALEGASSGESSGAFGWLKKKPAQASSSKAPERLRVATPSQEGLSPSAGPIVIGFAMPSDSDVVISPQTAVVETPADYLSYFTKPNRVPSQRLLTSAWSPDTDDGASLRRPSGMEHAGRAHVPAIPSVPQAYRSTRASIMTVSDEDEDDYLARQGQQNNRDTKTTDIFVSDDEDDMLTPVTLFEEDGHRASPRQKSLKAKGRQRSATNTSSRSQGWWDQVTSPFSRSPVTPQEQSAKEETTEWWKDTDKKKAPPPKSHTNPPGSLRSTAQQTYRPPRIIVEDVSPTLSSPLDPIPEPARVHARAEKTQMFGEDGREKPVELPPPYSPPSQNSQKRDVRYRAIFPEGHHLAHLYPPSPGPVSPGLSRAMTSQGAISLTNIRTVDSPTSTRLPERPLGSLVPEEHFSPVSGSGPRQKAERRRRRHEKEDAVAWKVGRLWSGRRCFPETSYFGKPGREGRMRRRVCLCVCLILLGFITAAIVIPLVLLRRTAPEPTTPFSPFLNLTEFPPIPTGIATVVGTDSNTRDSCVTPPTLWSCALPKEDASLAGGYDAGQPNFVLQIQFDNNTRQLWNVTGEEPPRPSPTSAGSGATPTPTPSKNKTARIASPRPRDMESRGGSVGVVSLLQHLIKVRRDGESSGPVLKPDPAPPSFQEMFFLGKTTDGVMAAEKAGEPTPFYISVLTSLEDSVGPATLSRQNRNTGPGSNQTSGNTGSLREVPPPALDRDGTGAPAVLLAFPKQQPLRLYDRGLPTERYGFYNYYNKTTYLESVAPLDKTGTGPVPSDQNGGARKSEARFIITWQFVRYKVEIWTRRENSTRLLSDGRRPADNSTRPGTFPYPITITLDNHGGQPLSKFTFVRSVDDRQRILLDDPKFVGNAMNMTGDLVNPAQDFNPSFGGMDGGTGGCRCELSYSGAGIYPSSRRSVLTLAIESSCDDTCVAVLDKSGPAARLLFNGKITSDNRIFGGVHPAAAVLAHTAKLAPLINEALQALPGKEDGEGEDGGQKGTLHIRDARTGRQVCRRVPDFVAVTRGPGMGSNLAVGLNTAKGLATAWQVPLLGVHHMQAHALTSRLVDALDRPWPAASAGASTTGAVEETSSRPSPQYPFLTLLISGGHTLLVLSRSLTSHSILASAMNNVAIGNMLDMCGRYILPADVFSSADSVMYAAELERFAFPDYPPATTGDEFTYDYKYTPPATRSDEIAVYDSGDGWTLTPPLAGRRDMAFDFAGLGSQVHRWVGLPKHIPSRRRLARETMRLAFEHLATRVIFALTKQRQSEVMQQWEDHDDDDDGDGPRPGPVRTLVVSGGVASNRYLRHVLRRVLDVRGFEDVEVVAPPPALCTDNAAMIAWAGVEMWEAGWRSDLEITTYRKWSLDSAAEDGGVLGVDGGNYVLRTE